MLKRIKQRGAGNNIDLGIPADRESSQSASWHANNLVNLALMYSTVVFTSQLSVCKPRNIREAYSGLLMPTLCSLLPRPCSHHNIPHQLSPSSSSLSPSSSYHIISSPGPCSRNLSLGKSIRGIPVSFLVQRFGKSLISSLSKAEQARSNRAGQENL